MGSDIIINSLSRCFLATLLKLSLYTWEMRQRPMGGLSMVSKAGLIKRFGFMPYHRAGVIAWVEEVWTC